MTGNTNGDRYRQAQEILWGEPGAWAHDTFDELNGRYFADEIPHAGIAWGLTPHGGRLGHTRCTGRITLHPALLDPHSDAWRIEPYLGEAYARDVLLHEMIHAYLFARSEEPDHNGQPWCREVMRLAPSLGLGEVRAAPVVPRRVDGRVVRRALDGHLDRHQLAHFPHSIRPNDFYRADRGRMPIIL